MVVPDDALECAMDDTPDNTDRASVRRCRAPAKAAPPNIDVSASSGYGGMITCRERR